ncbi:UDP-N-acetylmuramate dehydrogenase [Arthrobacter sp. NPDC089319]|uniref:UDP-N-acetylmuramate dehydrogenase n=1 Tax=Arthrobacter sp. NPDC089319 TaxID=3155915 RepID=UPI003435E58D
MVEAVAVDLASTLREAVTGSVRFNEPLDTLSRWRIGGRAAAIVEPSSATEAAAVLRVMAERPEPIVVIGETSNMLFDSRGFDGVLMRVGPRMSEWSIEGRRVHAEAGASIPELVRATAEAGLSGIIHAAGVPGTLGGLVLMNGGTQRKGIGEQVVRTLIANERGELHAVRHDDLGFAYRTSNLQGQTAAILEVELELVPGEPAALIVDIDAILAERAAKFPFDLPNCGSTFLSNPAMYSIVGAPGRAIEEAGLKSVRRGGAQISEKHANFIVNLGGATDNDVLWLIALVRTTVQARTGFTMDCEVRHLSPDGRMRPAHEVADERWPDLRSSEG